MEDSGFVLLLHEVSFHPNSYLNRLSSKFEVASVVRVHRKEELRKYRKPPLFDDKYLLIFDDLKVFEDNKAYIYFETMFPVLHLETKSQVEDAEFMLKESKLPYKIFHNGFEKEDAYRMIQERSSEPVSDNFCKTLVRQVGLSPLRIMTALDVCEQLGYKVSVIERYVDKWIYPDTRKLIECLLGVPRNASAVSNALMYLQLNRYWYRYVQKTLLSELDIVLQIFKDKLAGRLSSENIFEYIEEEHITRARVMFGLRLFEKVSITTVFALREFLKSASLLEVILRLV